jgi:hypothetical protein
MFLLRFTIMGFAIFFDFIHTYKIFNQNVNDIFYKECN